MGPRPSPPREVQQHGCLHFEGRRRNARDRVRSLAKLAMAAHALAFLAEPAEFMKRYERVAVPKRRRFARVVIHLSPSSRPCEALITQMIERALHFFGGRVDGECPAEFVGGHGETVHRDERRQGEQRHERRGIPNADFVVSQIAEFGSSPPQTWSLIAEDRVRADGLSHRVCIGRFSQGPRLFDREMALRCRRVEKWGNSGSSSVTWGGIR